MVEHITQGIGFRIVAVTDPDLVHLSHGRNFVQISVGTVLDLTAELAGQIGPSVFYVVTAGQLLKHDRKLASYPVIGGMDEKAVCHPSGSAGVFQTADNIRAMFQIFSV